MENKSIQDNSTIKNIKRGELLTNINNTILSTSSIISKIRTWYITILSTLIPFTLTYMNTNIEFMMILVIFYTIFILMIDMNYVSYEKSYRLLYRGKNKEKNHPKLFEISLKQRLPFTRWKIQKINDIQLFYSKKYKRYTYKYSPFSSLKSVSLLLFYGISSISTIFVFSFLLNNCIYIVLTIIFSIFYVLWLLYCCFIIPIKKPISKNIDEIL